MSPLIERIHNLQIYIVKSQLLQTFINSIWYVINIIVNLCSYKKLFSRNLAILDRQAKLLFSVVYFSAI
jgi:hypothetical protein